MIHGAGDTLIHIVPSNTLRKHLLKQKSKMKSIKMVLQGKVSLVYSLPSEKYWSRRQDKFSQLFQEGYVLLQCKAVKGKCQSKYKNVEKQSNSQTQRQKHNICLLGIRITQTNSLLPDCLKTQRQTYKVYPLKVRAKVSGHSYLTYQANEWE